MSLIVSIGLFLWEIDSMRNNFARICSIDVPTMNMSMNTQLYNQSCAIYHRHDESRILCKFVNSTQYIFMWPFIRCFDVIEFSKVFVPKIYKHQMDDYINVALNLLRGVVF